jgi:hypothetical protein
LIVDVQSVKNTDSAVQKVAAVSSTFHTAYLCSGILVSLLCSGNHHNLFVYLVWCFTLLAFNKVVNVPSVDGSSINLKTATPPLGYIPSRTTSHKIVACAALSVTSVQRR